MDGRADAKRGSREEGIKKNTVRWRSERDEAAVWCKRHGPESLLLLLLLLDEDAPAEKKRGAALCSAPGAQMRPAVARRSMVWEALRDAREGKLLLRRPGGTPAAG
jgi:hypothetical protein